MDPLQRQHFEQALARKHADADWRARMLGNRGAAPPKAMANDGLAPDAWMRVIARERAQDVPDPRTKSTRHGKLTADKWNQ